MSVFAKGQQKPCLDILIHWEIRFRINCDQIVDSIARSGGTPLIVAKNGKAMGVIHLKDMVKGGIKERFQLIRKMGIKTVMITGDNQLTAAAISAEAGVDDFLAEANPESKLKLIREYQLKDNW